MFIRFPPVRRPVPLFRSHWRDGSHRLKRFILPYEMHLYGSGTESLACALLEAKAASGKNKGEVLLPAYGCPDLVAASVFAGLEPKLVDTKPDAWGYDIAKLEAALTPSTVAIIAVNFLGVGDQARHLSELARHRGIYLVQDSAQYLPDGVVAQTWYGDCVVLSFGRGKPLNLLHGGALLTRQATRVGLVTPAKRTGLKDQILSSRFAALAFNVVTHPRFYWLASRLPGFRIGDTTYKRLDACRLMPGNFARQVASAFHAYWGAANYSQEKWQGSLNGWEAHGISLLRCDGEPKSDSQYLRLPLLATTKQDRDQIVERLNKAGLGASAMYEVPLNRIVGIPAAVVAQGPFPGAESLAARLFTLPTHELISASAVERTDAILRRCAATRVEGGAISSRVSQAPLP